MDDREKKDILKMLELHVKDAFSNDYWKLDANSLISKDIISLLDRIAEENSIKLDEEDKYIILVNSDLSEKSIRNTLFTYIFLKNKDKVYPALLQALSKELSKYDVASYKDALSILEELFSGAREIIHKYLADSFIMLLDMIYGPKKDEILPEIEAEMHRIIDNKIREYL